MQISETVMTPADAARLLENNTVNRKLSRPRAAALAAMIERGEWQLDGNPVKIADDGTVIDGQHRLRAIADSQTEGVPLILITGLPAETRLVTDTGRSRTFADYLEIKGVPNSLSVAAVVRGFWNHSNGLFDWHDSILKRPIPSHLQLWELYEKRRPDFEEAVSRSNMVIRSVRVSRATMATGWVVLGDVECSQCGSVDDDLDEFYEQLALRSKGPQSDGALVFVRLMNRRGAGREIETGRMSYTPAEQLALLFKAWNAYREGRTVSTLMWRRGGKTPERFPVPH